MDILTEKVCAEIIVKKSKFLAELFPCESASKARDILKSQKTKYSDSTHVVHGFICGLQGETSGASDDGEPSGTAGKPLLAVLKGRKCTNVFLSVTRWFGGTLLGTGGLVKAYGDAAKAVITEADAQNLFEAYIAKSSFCIKCDYTLYDKVKQTLKQFTIYDETEKFDSNIEISFSVAKDDVDKLAVAVKNATGGKININDCTLPSC